MFKGFQCIIGQFRTGVAILKFLRERFVMVCLRILKHGDPVGNPTKMTIFFGMVRSMNDNV